MMEVDICGEKLVMDPRRALFWPRASSLFAADTHFGKSAVFRREGIPLPEGSDEEDLLALSQLITRYKAKRLYILGDFVHGALPDNHYFYRQFNDWRASVGVEVHVVLGNHDIHLARHALHNIHWHVRVLLPPFELVHDPDETGEGYFLAGHIHPVTRISTRGDSLRMPVFWRRRNGMVLPSFVTANGRCPEIQRKLGKSFTHSAKMAAPTLGSNVKQLTHP